MAGAIDRAKAHFSKFQRRRIEVPEWADDAGAPLVIHVQPLTLADKQKLRQHAERGQLESLAYCLILKAEDADGKKVFTLDDKHALMTRVDPDVLARVAGEITAPLSDEDIAKN